MPQALPSGSADLAPNIVQPQARSTYCVCYMTRFCKLH